MSKWHMKYAATAAQVLRRDWRAHPVEAEGEGGA